MNFQNSIQSGFKHYADIRGRAARSEFWFWNLFCLIIFVAASFLDGIFFGSGGPGHSPTPVFYTVVALATFLPSICVGIRRLHDLDRSGWWLLIIFIPIVGAITLLVFDCLKGTEGDNRFGPNPLTNPAFPQN